MSAPEFVLSGRIRTQSRYGVVEAMHVRNGRIVALGERSLADELVGSGIEEIPLPDRAVAMPAFIDPHVHLAHYAVGSERGVDCRVPVCTGVSDVIERLRERAAQTPPGEWVIGYGNLFFDQKLAERRYPDRHELDLASTEHPIVLHCGGHVSMLNSRALEVIDVRRFMGPGQGLWGSPIVRLDERGEPTGYIAEIDAHLPIPAPTIGEISGNVKKRFHDELLRRGVVTVGEMLETEAQLQAYDALARDPGFGGRIALYAMSPSFRELEQSFDWVREFSARGDLLWAQGVKIFADGGYSARNAASIREYAEEQVDRAHYRGVLNQSRGELLRAFELAAANSVQLAVHTNGTRAQAEVLQALDGFAAHVDVRVEHLGNVLEDTAYLDEWKRANVLPVMQPGFLSNFIGDYMPMLFPGSGIRGRMPLRTILDAAIQPAISSDFGLGADIGATNPWQTIWSAVSRKTFWGLTVEPHEAISVEEAVLAHTVRAAEAIGRSGELGAFAPGMLADIVIYREDPFLAELDALRETRAHRVYRGGELVHAEEEGS